MAKYERRFAGKDNAGLRAQIRSVVTHERCGQGNAQAVRSLASTVALSAFGKACLEDVAADYALSLAKPAHCDCCSCSPRKLRLIVSR